MPIVSLRTCARYPVNTGFIFPVTRDGAKPREKANWDRERDGSRTKTGSGKINEQAFIAAAVRVNSYLEIRHELKEKK
jgi:hypothetical protein